MKGYLTFKELVTYTGFAEKTLRDQIYKRRIPCYRPPGVRVLLFKITEIDQWIAAGRRPTAAEL